MWEEIQYKTKKQQETEFFLDWVNRVVMAPEHVRAAEDLFLQVAKAVPEVAACRATPQSAPWHVEGKTAADGIIRMLAAINAIVHGASIMNIEEFARHKALQHEVRELEEMIREHAATLQAYSLVHDIAKPVTLNFSAPVGSKGEAEGFAEHKYRFSRYATDSEKQLYTKLLNAFEVQHPDLVGPKLMAAFFDEYEISTHYKGHAKRGASQEFFAAREKVADLFRLQDIDRRMITFMIRQHMNVLTYFADGPNPQKFDMLSTLATKAGLDGDDVLDVLLAGTFLDSSVGSLAYKEGRFFVDTTALVHWLQSEELVAPLRRARRRDLEARRQKERLMSALERAKLSPEEVFELFDVSFGPKRGEIMEEIYALVKDPNRSIEFGSQTTEMADRIKKARTFFDASGRA